jgi:hypothetical protein
MRDLIQAWFSLNLIAAIARAAIVELRILLRGLRDGVEW